MVALSTILLFVAVVAAIIVKGRKVLMSSSWYKSVFAKGEAQFASITRKVFAPLKEKMFADLNKHLKTVKGDILEIGIGAGENFSYYPDCTSLIAVDSNPHVEKLLKTNLAKVGDRIRLKKFDVASADKLDVADNSVAAAVCTMVLCSVADGQIRKTLQEVKRVLMPGGRFYFLEHVAGKPWTVQYIAQHLSSKSFIWPTVFNHCYCHRETLSRIEEVGFKMIQAEKILVDLTPEMFSECKSTTSILITKLVLRFVNSIVFGFAEKGESSENRKSL